MNAAHLHLLVNHLPIAFTFVALLVAVIGLIGKSGAIKKLALGLMVLVGMASATAYLSGKAAEAAQFGPGSPNQAQVERHKESAEVTWIIGLAGGVLGLTALLAVRKMQDVPTAFVVGSVIVLLVTLYFFAKTTNLGGQIQHPETRSDPLSKFLNP